MGGMFKTSTRGSVTTGQEMVDLANNRRGSTMNSGLIFIDIATGKIPPGIQILNMETNSSGKHKFQKVTSGEQ